MTSLIWLQWGCPKVHAFVVIDGVRAKRTLCNNYIGRESEADVVEVDPTLGNRCGTCDDIMRARGRKARMREGLRRDVYHPQHKFKEWE